jgi:hypothetical protein
MIYIGQKSRPHSIFQSLRMIPLVSFFPFLFSFLISFLLSCKINSAQAQAQANEWYYEYNDREHTFSESLLHMGAMYAFSWGVYGINQQQNIRHYSSSTTYKNNLGKIVFDKDEPIWNWVGHPIVGSQMYLYYRGLGYTQQRSILFTFIQSALFETTIEILTEPASIQDLYQTPILGSALGFFLEQISLPLLNSNSWAARLVGHLINPTSIFWFYEGRVRIVPQITNKSNEKIRGLVLQVDWP